MWIRKLTIFIFLIGLSVSCNKDPYTWDREIDLETDTTTFLYQSKYISNIDTQVVFQLDMVTLNGLESEKYYTNSTFYDSVQPYLNFSYTINNVSVQQKSSSAYTTVLLFDQNGTYWHNENFMGIYLRRYFEQVETSNTSQVALAKFSPQNNEPVSFYKENANSYLQNSWEFNTNKFYELSNNSDNLNYVTSNILYIIDRLNEAIDTLISSSDKNGDLSITFFSQGGYEVFQSETVEINALINKAKTNNIKINLIGFANSTESDFRRIAQETGGFICSLEINYSTYQPNFNDNKKITSIAVCLENLDLILHGDLVTHQCIIQVDRTDGGMYQPGNKLTFSVNYNHNLFNVQFTLP